jgi:hypothetical protein
MSADSRSVTGPLLLLFATMAALSGCSHERFYTGDGRFTDNGFMAYDRHYVIDLGAINLSVPGTYAYRLSGLPHAEFCVEIRVFEDKKNEWHVTPDYPANVRVELRTDEGETVILEDGSLNTWVRSYSALENFSDLYLRGEARDIPLPGGGTRGEQLGVKASGGWGTYFKSDVGKAYVLNLEVLSSDQSMIRPARLMTVGW